MIFCFVAVVVVVKMFATLPNYRTFNKPSVQLNIFLFFLDLSACYVMFSMGLNINHKFIQISSIIYLEIHFRMAFFPFSMFHSFSFPWSGGMVFLYVCLNKPGWQGQGLGLWTQHSNLREEKKTHTQTQIHIKFICNVYVQYNLF